jgi:hypothetical protein
VNGDESTTGMGPVQMMVLGFAEPDFTGRIAAELDRLRAHDLVRIIDALVVQKDDAGDWHQGRVRVVVHRGRPAAFGEAPIRPTSPPRAHAPMGSVTAGE